MLLHEKRKTAQEGLFGQRLPERARDSRLSYCNLRVDCQKNYFFLPRTRPMHILDDDTNNSCSCQGNDGNYYRSGRPMDTISILLLTHNKYQSYTRPLSMTFATIAILAHLSNALAAGFRRGETPAQVPLFQRSGPAPPG